MNETSIVRKLIVNDIGKKDDGSKFATRPDTTKSKRIFLDSKLDENTTQHFGNRSRSYQLYSILLPMLVSENVVDPAKVQNHQGKDWFGWFYGLFLLKLLKFVPMR